MKKVKKHPRKQLEKFSNIFIQLGLVLVLFIVFVILEHRTVKTEKIVDGTLNPSEEVMTYSFSTFIKIPKLVKVKSIRSSPKRAPMVRPLLAYKPVEQIPKNEMIQTAIGVIDNSINKPPKMLNGSHNKEVSRTPIGISNVQKAPVFKGCENLNEQENRKCFEGKMKQLVRRNFDINLAYELGLTSGKKRIMTQFIIDENGDVKDVTIRAPHPKLKEEAIRIINKIPKLTPGIQNNKTVRVKYTLPISFKIE